MAVIHFVKRPKNPDEGWEDVMKFDGQPPASPQGKDQEQLRREAAIAKHLQNLAPVLEDLARIGIHVNRLADLETSEKQLRAAMPILLKWLPRLGDRHAKEDIVRTLTVRWAKAVALPILVEEYRQVDDPTSSGLRWAIGNALEVMADESIADDLMELAREPKYGRARDMVVLALGKIKNPRAVDVLIDALNDEDTVGPAIRALGKLKAERAVPAIERCLAHSNPWIRKEAAKVLARIAKARQAKEARRARP